MERGSPIQYPEGELVDDSAEKRNMKIGKKSQKGRRETRVAGFRHESNDKLTAGRKCPAGAT